MSGDFLIFSSKRSFLLRKRIMDVSVNHLLLQIESNNLRLSCIRFYRNVKVKQWENLETTDIKWKKINVNHQTINQSITKLTHAICKSDINYINFMDETRAVKRLISLILLITRLIFFKCTFITVLMHILFVTFFNLFVSHLQVDVVSPLLLNASLLLVLLLLVCVSFTIIGQPRNSVLIRRV